MSCKKLGDGSFNQILSFRERRNSMKKVLFFFITLITTCLAFSQDKVLSVKEIDSICDSYGRYGVADGIIKIENKKKEKIGAGRYSLTTYLNYYNQEHYNSLSREEKKRYNREKDSELIKGIYFQSIAYSSYTENIFSEFYYFNNEFFFVKIKVEQIDKNGKTQVENFNLTYQDYTESKSIKNPLLFEVQSWIRKKNFEILKFYNKK